MSLIVYGSLLDKDEVNEVLKLKGWKISLRPVKVFGFKRIFYKVSDRRAGEGTSVAVLNVEETNDPVDFFNGILISDLSENDLKDLEKREQGYELIQIDSKNIEPYGGPLSISGPIYVFTALRHKVKCDIEPIPEYSTLSLKGAESWGKQFLDDFKKSTFKANGDKAYA